MSEAHKINTTQMSPPEIRIDDLTVSYGRVPAVHHLTGRFAPGSLTAIAGPNGAGKSTLLKAIAGLLPLDEGQIDRGNGKGHIAYLPQLAEIDRSFPISLLDVVSLGFWRETGLFRRLTNKHLTAARQALSAVGLEGLEQQQVGKLSVGQLQRALFARLILQDAEIVLLDEPFAAVDERTGSDLMDLVLRWQKEGRTVIAVLHDLERIRRFFPETLLLASGAVGWGATADVLTEDNLRRARYIADRQSEAGA